MTMTNTTTTNNNSNSNSNSNNFQAGKELALKLRALGFNKEANALMVCGSPKLRGPMMEQFSKLLSGAPKAAPVAAPAPKKVTPIVVKTAAVVTAVILTKDLPKGGTLGHVRKKLESLGITEVEADFSGQPHAVQKGDLVLEAHQFGIKEVSSITKQAAKSVVKPAPKATPKPTPKAVEKVVSKATPKPAPKGLKEELRAAIKESIAESNAANLEVNMKSAVVEVLKPTATTTIRPRKNVAFLVVGSNGKARLCMDPSAIRAFKGKKAAALKSILN